MAVPQHDVPSACAYRVPSACRHQVVSAKIPITRSDILHACDVAEDVAIAYGFNNVPKRVPGTCTTGKEQPINLLTDLLRPEMAAAGFTEVHAAPYIPATHTQTDMVHMVSTESTERGGFLSHIHL